MTASDIDRAPRLDARSERVALTIETSAPGKWLLVDRETGRQWEWRDGEWCAADAYLKSVSAAFGHDPWAWSRR